MNDTDVLVEVRRGNLVESRHRGYVVAVDNSGKILASTGNSEIVTYLRSSAKPFQMLPTMQAGAVDYFGFSKPEIAVACGSHSGENLHVAAVALMLEKIGLGKNALKCGTHEPFDRQIARELRCTSTPPDVLQNNCSGKHTAMLALAKFIGAPTETYDFAENPVQQTIKASIAQFAGMEESEIVVGVDGCGVPVFGMSLQRMAKMYARLVAPVFDAETNQAATRIVDAMREFPEMIGGTRERLDTEIMHAAKGLLISKVGAEGVYTAGVLPSAQYPNGLGIALKIEDGEDRRARPVAVIKALRDLHLLDKQGSDAMEKYARFAVKNNRGEAVGEIAPAFELKFV